MALHTGNRPSVYVTVEASQNYWYKFGHILLSSVNSLRIPVIRRGSSYLVGTGMSVISRRDIDAARYTQCQYERDERAKIGHWIMIKEDSGEYQSETMGYGSSSSRSDGNR
jgi:hypothetical protein